MFKELISILLIFFRKKLKVERMLSNLFSEASIALILSQIKTLQGNYRPILLKNINIKILPFQPGTGRMAPAKKGSEKKKGQSAINKVVTREYTNSIHKRIHGVGFKKYAPRALKEIRKSAMKEMGTPDVCIDTRTNKPVWAKGIRNVPYHIHVRLSRKRNEVEDSPNKLYTLVTCVSVTTFKNLQTVNVDEN
ncbi:60S ribosomal protein L31-like [Physeter macrocephalus]|uniref:Large ribosomal subunit protein eL31 n=1 Tax=Physeter macrocephalus TaxID=9755 RepID=A0A9W2X2M6_PHYMC|nr:60S ribosomal protein L31-like [Physeter catodon]XP_054945698.1 60S ribosomal protein L31-like [Physeter catodon]